MADFPLVSKDALAGFREASARIVASTVDRSLARTDEIAGHGSDARRLITAGIEFTVRMLDAALASGEGALMEDELSWALDRLPHDGVAPEHILGRFQVLREVISAELSRPQAEQIVRAVDWMSQRLRELGAEKGSSS
jgi:MerR family transcriptional regulator, light-induced transcriptional regulator